MNIRPKYIATKPLNVTATLVAIALLLFAPLLLAAPGAQQQAGAVTYRPDLSYTLKTHIGKEGMVYLGVGGAIDGLVNPTLRVPAGAIVQITLVNGDGAEHDLSVPEFKALSDHVIGLGASSSIVFKADADGSFPYFCTLPGHRQAGMEGKIVVGQEKPASSAPKLPDVSRDPADLPAAVGKRGPMHVRVDLDTREVRSHLADGTTYTYWTFGGKVPGPMLRVRVGDTVEVHLKNAKNSRMIHSIDLHAVTGPGGGAAVMQVPPGQERSFTFKALKPGVYVYHCATPMVAEHISNGMFGLIVVEPAGGLPKVDHEFYVMQSELYTTRPFGFHGNQEFDVARLLVEQPTYFVFNGTVGALTKDHPMRAKVGDSVHIFFGVGGPNFTSSFHMIGEIFDDVYEWGSLQTPPLRGVQTVSVPPGGAAMADLHLEVPGKYILVDHALSRMELGLAGYLLVTGPKAPHIYHANP